MAFATYTQSFGTSYANGTVSIVEAVTGIPATVMAATTGGVINTQGQATLDASGNLSVIIDTARTWIVTAFDGVANGVVDPFSYVETAALRTSMTAGQLAGLKLVNAQTGTAYTLALTDAGKEVTMNNASANTLTVPTNATIAFPLQTQIDVVQVGAGVTTVGGAGITFIKPSALTLAIAAQYGGLRLTKVGTDLWRVNSI